MMIAAGSNIYTRGQCSTGGNYYRASLYPYYGNFSFNGFGRHIVLGDNTSDTGGQALTTTYAELSSALPFTVKMICPIVFHVSVTSAVIESKISIATGSLGNEVEIYARRMSAHSVADYILHPESPPMPIHIAEGQRVAIKMSDADGNNKMDAIVYCYG